MEQTSEKVNKNRMVILFSVVLMTFMATLDGSIVNVALPDMADKLSVSTEAVAWVVSSYLIVISGSILVFGRLGDIKGKTSIFKYGIVIFTIGSLLCGFANSLSILILARALQAIGAAATMANNQGIITQVFPGNERGKALGISGTFVALGSMAGPPIGGFIISKFSWHYIFLINVPVGIVVFILALKNLPKPKKIREEKLDARGASLFAVSVVALFTSLIMGEDYGYHNPAIFAGLAVSVLTFVIFIALERRTQDPLLQLSLFKNKLFSLSIFCAFISFVSINSTMIIQPFYLQNVLKYTPAMTGLIMVVYPLVMSVVAPVSGYLSDKIGSEFLTFLGLVANSAGLFLMATLNEHSSLYVMIFYIIIMSLGNALFQSPNTSLIMANAPRNMLGISGSVNALIRNLGMISGTTMAILILYGRMSAKIGYSVSTYISGRDDVFVYGMQGAYMAAALISALGALLTAFRLYRIRKTKLAEVKSEP
jgi:EmrB/QacA subfamily drug resistance transporter